MSHKQTLEASHQHLQSFTKVEIVQKNSNLKKQIFTLNDSWHQLLFCHACIKMMSTKKLKNKYKFQMYTPTRQKRVSKCARAHCNKFKAHTMKFTLWCGMLKIKLIKHEALMHKLLTTHPESTQLIRRLRRQQHTN